MFNNDFITYTTVRVFTTYTCNELTSYTPIPRDTKRVKSIMNQRIIIIIVVP